MITNEPELVPLDSAIQFVVTPPNFPSRNYGSMKEWLTSTDPTACNKSKCSTGSQSDCEKSCNEGCYDTNVYKPNVYAYPGKTQMLHCYEKDGKINYFDNPCGDPSTTCDTYQSYKDANYGRDRKDLLVGNVTGHTCSTNYQNNMRGSKCLHLSSQFCPVLYSGQSPNQPINSSVRVNINGNPAELHGFTDGKANTPYVMCTYGMWDDFVREPTEPVTSLNPGKDCTYLHPDPGALMQPGSSYSAEAAQCNNQMSKWSGDNVKRLSSLVNNPDDPQYPFSNNITGRANQWQALNEKNFEKLLSLYCGGIVDTGCPQAGTQCPRLVSKTSGGEVCRALLRCQAGREKKGIYGCYRDMEASIADAWCAPGRPGETQPECLCVNPDQETRDMEDVWRNELRLKGNRACMPYAPCATDKVTLADGNTTRTMYVGKPDNYTLIPAEVRDADCPDANTICTNTTNVTAGNDASIKSIRQTNNCTNEGGAGGSDSTPPIDNNVVTRWKWIVLVLALCGVILLLAYVIYVKRKR